MTRADRDLFRGWQAAQRGLPLDPYETEEWREGYMLYLKSRERRAA